VAGILLSPVMPEKMHLLLTNIGWTKAPKFDDAITICALAGGTPIVKGDALFPRIEWKAES